MLRVDPTTGATYDDGLPDPAGGTWATDATGAPAYAPTPDVQAMIDQVMAAPQANPNAGPAPMPDPRGLPPPVVDQRDVSGAPTPSWTVDHASGAPIVINNNYGGKGGDRALAADKTAIAAGDAAAVADGAAAPAPELTRVSGSASSSSSKYDKNSTDAIMSQDDMAALLDQYQAQLAGNASAQDAGLAENAAALDQQLAAIQAEKGAIDGERAANRTAIEDYRIRSINAEYEHQQKMVAIKARADAAGQRYMQDAAAARAMVSDPYANMRGAGGAMGFLAMAGHTCLANMGPGSPVLPDIPGMIDKIIQNTIYSQDAAQRNAWKAVVSDDNIWNLARQGADDEVEAAERYRGFLTEAYNTQVAVNAAKFAGPKAAAAAQAAQAAAISASSEAAAKIRAAREKADLDILMEAGKRVDNAVDNSTSRISSSRSLSGTLANIKASDAARKAAADAHQFIDPETGTVIGTAQDAEGWMKGTEYLNGASDVVSAVTRLEALSAGVKSKLNIGPLDTTFTNQATADFDAIYEDMIAGIVRARSGSAFTGEEVTAARASFPRDEMLKGLLGGDVDSMKIRAAQARESIAKARTRIRTFSKEGTSNPGGAIAGADASLQITSKPEDHKVDMTIPTLVAGASGRMRGTNKRNVDMFKPKGAAINRKTYDMLKAAVGDRAMTPRSANPTRGSWATALVGNGAGQIGPDMYESAPVPPPEYGVGATVPAYMADAIALWELTASPDAGTAKSARSEMERMLQSPDMETEGYDAIKALLATPYTDQATNLGGG